jgi:hypothetical protein
MRRLVLHIGHPKTGTSTLQGFLYTHREQLLERGVLYPLESDSIGSQLNLARSFERGYKPAPNGLTFEKLADQIRDSDAEVFVLSSEWWVVRPDQANAASRIREFAADAGLTVDVLAFVRPQHAYVNSFYTQLVKRFHETRRLARYADEAITRPMLDYSNHLAEWDRGDNMRLIPIPFTSARLQPNLETAFFEAAGLADRAGDVLADAGARRANTAPGPLSVEVCRRVGAHLEKRGDANDNRVRGRLSRSVLRVAAQKMSWDKRSFNGLDNELRERLDARVRESNEAFADRYWDADWYEVFAPEYETDLVSNEFGRSQTTMRDRRAVEATTRIAIRRANFVLEGPQSRPEPRRRNTRARRGHAAA